MKSMTSGNPGRLILAFALPMLIGSFVQIFYTLSDSYIVSRTLGVSSYAAVGSTAVLIAIIYGFNRGLVNGFCIVCAQRFGAGDIKGTAKSFVHSFSLCMIAGLAISAVLLPAARIILAAVHTPEEIADDAFCYLATLIGFVSLTMASDALSSMLLAVGDSKSPLAFQLASSIVNVVLDCLFIMAFHMGVFGAAIATVISQVISGSLCALKIFSKYPELLPEKGGWRLESGECLVHLKLGASMAFQQSIIWIGNIFVQSSVNAMGTVVIAAVAMAQRIREINMSPIFCVAAAASVFTAQNNGANLPERIISGIKHSVLIVLAASVFMAFFNLLMGRGITEVLLEGNPEAAGLAYTYLLYVGFTLILLGFMLVFRSMLQGLKKTAAPTICSVMETAMSLACALYFVPAFGFIGVCLANPLSWLVSGIPIYIASCRHISKISRKRKAR
ncbi:MAG: MATE family efflux transporter [Clostridiales bacterium]|jgi:putative MATE family efflux protein|nr:MATE family efflux transporter [Clostridiales bacterium]